MKIETIPDTVVVAPPVGVVAASVFGVPIQTWVLWLNLIYIQRRLEPDPTCLF